MVTKCFGLLRNLKQDDPLILLKGHKEELERTKEAKKIHGEIRFWRRQTEIRRRKKTMIKEKSISYHCNSRSRRSGNFMLPMQKTF